MRSKNKTVIKSSNFKNGDGPNEYGNGVTDDQNKDIDRVKRTKY
jgi:hypothetical protein